MQQCTCGHLDQSHAEVNMSTGEQIEGVETIGRGSCRQPRGGGRLTEGKVAFAGLGLGRGDLLLGFSVCARDHV